MTDDATLSENFSSRPDAELVKAAQRGDKRAFVEIVARHQAMVCGVALGVLGDFAASEDAAQEAFITVWRKIHELREPEKVRVWLARIARNAALGQRRRTGPPALTLDEECADDGQPMPDQAAVTDEEATLVREALDKLPETYRLPLVLFYRHDHLKIVPGRRLGSRRVSAHRLCRVSGARTRARRRADPARPGRGDVREARFPRQQTLRRMGAPARRARARRGGHAGLVPSHFRNDGHLPPPRLPRRAGRGMERGRSGGRAGFPARLRRRPRRRASTCPRMAGA